MNFNRLLATPLRLVAKHKSRSKFQTNEIILQSNPDLIKQAQELTKMMANADIPTLPEKAENLISIESLTVGRALYLIDTSFETFFKNREINQKNFLLLLRAAGEQRQIKTVLSASEKMELLGIKNNEIISANLINALTKCKEFEKARNHFEQSLIKFGANVTLYSAGLFLASKSRDFELAKNIWTRATIVDKIKPNLELLTAMISACYANHQIKECWNYYDKHIELKIHPDDVLLGLMIKVCAKSQSAEKAKMLWKQMDKLESVRLTAHHYDSIILALASRKDYAEEALQKYEEMKTAVIQPTRLTFVGVLEATSKLGDIDSAYNAIVQMNALKIRQNDQIFDGLLKTYASALIKPNLPKELKEMYLADAWKLFDSIVETSPSQVTAHILNSLALVHVNGDKLEEAEDAVLPLFEKFGIQKNGDTYKVFIQGFFRNRNLVKVRLIFDNLVNIDTNLLNLDSLNTCLDTFIRIRDVDRITKTLDIFQEKQRTPQWKFMHYLADMGNLPDEIYARLRSFKFGEIILRDKPRTFFPKSDLEREFMTRKEMDRSRVRSQLRKGEKIQQVAKVSQ